MAEGHCRVSSTEHIENECREPRNLTLFPSGIAISVGGPAFVEYIRPTDEELVKRYNPDLQKRSAEQGERRAQEFDDYVKKLKEWSKSDKSSMYRWRGATPTASPHDPVESRTDPYSS